MMQHVLTWGGIFKAGPNGLDESELTGIVQRAAAELTRIAGPSASRIERQHQVTDLDGVQKGHVHVLVRIRYFGLLTPLAAQLAHEADKVPVEIRHPITGAKG